MSQQQKRKGGASKAQESFFKKDPVIDKLGKCLRKKTNNPDDVLNILSTDLEEKQKIKEMNA